MFLVQREFFQSVKNSKPFKCLSKHQLFRGVSEYGIFNNYNGGKTHEFCFVSYFEFEILVKSCKMLHCRITLFCKLIIRELKFQ
jgi:hypothetical protein